MAVSWGGGGKQVSPFVRVIAQKQKRLNLSAVDFDFIKLKSQFRNSKKEENLKETSRKQYLHIRNWT